MCAGFERKKEKNARLCWREEKKKSTRACESLLTASNSLGTGAPVVMYIVVGVDGEEEKGVGVFTGVLPAVTSICKRYACFSIQTHVNLFSFL